MLYLLFHADLNHSLFLTFSLLFILIYEAINGFHDTANAVSTLIYTKAMPAHISVIMSGLFNFLGVILGGLTVAYAIVHLLPRDLLVNIHSKHAVSMIFAMLLTAIIWNLSTWYFCLPSSSSHSLIGAIIGIGLTNAIITNSSLIKALNIPKILSIVVSLLIAPIIGLIISGSVIFILKNYLFINKKKYRINMNPAEREKRDAQATPPLLIRLALILSSIGVSYTHGANDGQKGIGLIMIVLIGIFPSSFMINLNSEKYQIICTKHTLSNLEKYYLTTKNTNILQDSQNIFFENHKHHVIKKIQHVKKILTHISNYNNLHEKERYQLHHLLLYISDSIDNTMHSFNITPQEQFFLKQSKKNILDTIEYAPIWVIFIIACTLSIGTMIGWKRIVVTVGEKIGKTSMTYAQAISAQITTSLSVGIASYTGIPVSTTHILTSSIVGTMLVNGNGIHKRTVKYIVLSWILTIPISMLISSILYWILLFVV